jgi:threonylcarbamoyladenosine tRNA methylthiotransferase MtaB
MIQKVQAGCEHRCTFCIIPFARGHGRSVPPEVATRRIAALVDAGAREVVLTGVDLTGYGAGLSEPQSLGRLVEHILRDVPGLARLRLSSLDTIEIDPLLAELIAGEPRLMPHLHLSLQSGDDMILKRMRRRHGRDVAVRTVADLKARRPDLAIGADLIAGFPTETAAMAANSLSLIEECDIVFAHVFPFSPREGTPAARMPQVEPEVARERARLLREASAARRSTWLQGLVGTRQRVLMERGGTGHAENFAKVRPAMSAAVGEIVDVRIAAVDGDTLLGSAE